MGPAHRWVAARVPRPSWDHSDKPPRPPAAKPPLGLCPGHPTWPCARDHTLLPISAAWGWRCAQRPRNAGMGPPPPGWRGARTDPPRLASRCERSAPSLNLRSLPTHPGGGEETTRLPTVSFSVQGSASEQVSAPTSQAGAWHPADLSSHGSGERVTGALPTAQVNV